MADDLIPNQIITLLAIILGLICIYFSNISIIGGILVIISSLLATVFGTNTLRHIGKYSLGTGVPSIVYMLTAIGLVSYLGGMIFSSYLKLPLLFPISSLILAFIISLLVSLICKYIFDIQVEILTKSFISITVASVLLMLSLSALIVQTWDPNIIYGQVIQNGLILMVLILSVMIVQNPYNSCMGPNEEQYRTLSLACANASLSSFFISIVAMLNTEYWILYMLISIILWIIFFRKYVIYTKQQAASIKTCGLWPTGDGGD